jgi:hypothetical protein
MAEESGSSVRLLRWCGIALVPAGVLMVVVTLLHPSRETATTIIASEAGLVAAHFLYTRFPGCWSCSDCPDSMSLSGKPWDGWDWQASWLHFPAPI